VYEHEITSGKYYPFISTTKNDINKTYNYNQTNTKFSCILIAFVYFRTLI